MGRINVYGTFQVTTEADCEGRSTKNLGVYTGFIDEIALHLADKSYYSLRFREIEQRTSFPPTLEDVHVSFDDSFPLNVAQMAFKNRPVEVSDGQFYHSFLIKRELSQIEKDEIIRQKALLKLSVKEREVLGL
jgi:hypothetical protein